MMSVHLWTNVQGDRCINCGISGAQYHNQECPMVYNKGWHPITTAPVDGTKILIFLESGAIVVCQYGDNGPHWRTSWNFDNLDDECNTPVFWMPLPQPPE